MRKKIKFYRELLVEIVETLCTICLYLETEGMRSHNQYSRFMRGHFNELKYFSETMRKDMVGKENKKVKKPDFDCKEWR